MTPHADILIKLDRENKKLREKLTIAEQWIGRELSEMRFRKMKSESTRNTRIELTETDEERDEKDFKNTSEKKIRVSSMKIESSWENLKQIFRTSFDKKNSMVSWLQTPIQKILENIFEEHITKYFREENKKGRVQMAKNDILEKTLYKVIKSDFHLSLGKIYLILKNVLKRILAEARGGFPGIQSEKLPLYSVIKWWRFLGIFHRYHGDSRISEKNGTQEK
jgi:hypothetical protein